MSYQRPTENNEQTRVHSSYIDKNLVIIVGFLIVIGLISTFSAMVPKEIRAGINPIGILIKQILFIGAGAGCMYFFTKVDYRKYAKIAIPFAWFVVGLLILVKYTPLGVTVNGAKRWLGYGLIQFQPSELAKPAVSALLACAFYKDAKIWVAQKWKSYFLPIICMLFLIYKQPNLSMVMLLLITSVVIYLCAGGKRRYFVIPTIGAVLSFPILMSFLHAYQLTRLRIWINPDIDPRGDGFNIIQSTMAFVSGGLFGNGFGNSKQKLGWLPEGHTDFIFAVYAEEFGFIGCVVLIGLFLMFIQRGFSISARCNDMFGKILALGLTASIGFQAFINMGVASAMLPATGVTLPFISYGGTSLIITMCMVGILLNISKKKIIRIKSYE